MLVYFVVATKFLVIHLARRVVHLGHVLTPEYVVMIPVVQPTIYAVEVVTALLKTIIDLL